ncbi:MAG TPA: amidohydrolase family protein [Panacibacter sp.]|nr:amidohydrolase family protein [Panacibacter sp.]
MHKIFPALAILFITITAAAQRTIIYCGKMIDVVNSKTLSNYSIIIQGNKIIEVKEGFVKSESTDKVIDLKSKTVMPGLMDMHVHMEEETHKGAAADEFTVNPADIAFGSLAYARVTLMAGFTTVRDLGGSGVNVSLRNAINRHLVTGPRIYTAEKAIATTGGHADPTNGYRDDLKGDPGPKDGVINGVEDAYKAVRQRYKNGADLIKITATGGVLSQAKSGSNAQFTEEEIKAIVAAAKDYGFKVAAHAHGAEGIKRAIRGGVSSIEHGTYMDDEAIGLMKQYGTYYVPTITAGKSVADSAKIPGYYTDIVTPKALAIGPQIQSTFAKAYKAGVKIAFGTDAAVYAHGKNWLEFVYMTEAGMPAMEAIRCATVHAADLLGNNQLGSIEKDKLADIIAVDGDPIADIRSMGKVVFVMKDGEVFKNE